MTKSTKEIDRLIREALSDADAELLDQFGDQSLPELLTETFHGRHRLFVVGGMVVTLAFFGAGIFGAVQFVRAIELREMMLWGAATAFCFGAVTASKIWYWLEMTRHALVRDVKRLELQIVQLAQRLSDREGVQPRPRDTP